MFKFDNEQCNDFREDCTQEIISFDRDVWSYRQNSSITNKESKCKIISYSLETIYKVENWYSSNVKITI